MIGRGENVDLAGTITTLDFDPKTGDPTIDLAIYCLKNEKGEIAPIESGMYWRGSDRRLSGEIKCP